MRKTTLLTALLLVLLMTLSPNLALASDNPTAMKGDMTLASAPINTDSPSGETSVKLYLQYKGSTLFTNSNLAFFELSPVVDKPDEFPFDITWTSYTLKAQDQKEDTSLKDENSVMGANARYFEFKFKTKKDVVNGYYPLTFKVRYLNNGQNIINTEPVEDNITIYVQIKYGKEATESPSPTPAPEATPKPQAKVILKSYSMDPQEVVGGENFSLKLVLQNTSSKQTVRNMKFSLSESKGQVLPASGSSSFYVDKISSGEDYEIVLDMQARPDAGLENAVTMSLSMEYDDPNPVTATETFTLPIHQVIKLKIDEPYVPSDVYVDEQFDISLGFYNVGKATMYNTMVTLESDTMRTEEGTYFVGTMAPGAQARYEGYVTIPSNLLQNATPAEPSMEESPAVDPPLGTPDDGTVQPDGSVGSLGNPVARSASAVAIAMPAYGGGGYSKGGGGGVNSMIATGTIVISYEDNMGQAYRKELPVSVNVMSFDMDYGNDNAMMPYLDPETGLMIDPVSGQYLDPNTMMPIERGMAPWIIIILVAGGIVLIIAAIIIIRKVGQNKRKKMEMEMENEVE